MEKTFIATEHGEGYTVLPGFENYECAFMFQSKAKSKEDFIKKLKVYFKRDKVDIDALTIQIMEVTVHNVSIIGGKKDEKN